MVSSNDPVESFFNSIQVMKESLSPLEVGFRKAAKDLEHCFAGAKNRGNGVCLVAQVRDGGEFQICDVKKKKGLSMKVPFKAILGMFSQNSGNGNKTHVVKENENGSSCTNCLQFSVTWSLLVNGFIQSLPIPFKSGKKRFQKVSDEDNNSNKVCSCMKQSISAFEVKNNESKGQFARTIKEKVARKKDGKHVSIECLIGFIFDQLSHTLQSLDHGINGMQENNNNDFDCVKTSLPQPCSAPFGHVNAFTSFLEEHKVDVNGFLGNLNFAKVGVPSSAAGEESLSTNEGGDNNSNSVNDETKEESVGISAQKVASNIFSIPLTNVERLKTTLSTVSLTELIELLPQLGKTTKDHPDKKKLFSVQDFFRYTESEGATYYN